MTSHKFDWKLPPFLLCHAKMGVLLTPISTVSQKYIHPPPTCVTSFMYAPNSFRSIIWHLDCPNLKYNFLFKNQNKLKEHLLLGLFWCWCIFELPITVPQASFYFHPSVHPSLHLGSTYFFLPTLWRRWKLFI